MNHEENYSTVKTQWHGSLGSYAIGFGISFFLTTISFLLVAFHKYFGKEMVVILIITLAIAQAIGQILFFLHVGKEAKPRWEISVLLFMVMVVFIVVIGSIWIMYELNQRMMPGHTSIF